MKDQRTLAASRQFAFRDAFKTGLLLAALGVWGCSSDDDLAANDDSEEGMDETPDPSEPADPGTDPSSEPRGESSPPDLGAQIDRSGRPAVSTATVATFFGPEMAMEKRALKDEYGAARPEDWSSFIDGMADSLGILDGIDQVCGNQLSDGSVEDDDEARYNFLATVLSDDRLLIDSANDAGHCDQYLGQEGLALGAVDADTGGCGGRTPSADVADRSYSVLIAGELGGWGDSVDLDDVPRNDRPDDDTFPFLPAP